MSLPMTSRRRCAAAAAWEVRASAVPASQAAATLAVAAAGERPAESGKQSNRAKGRRLAAARERGPNLTDPESRVVKSGQVFVRGYNAQVAVGDDHLVVACDVSTDNVDHALLEPMIDAVRAQLGPDEDDSPVEFLADAGYWKGEAVERLRHRGERVLVPPNGRPRTRGLDGNTVVTTDTRRPAEAGEGKAFRRKTGPCQPVHPPHKVHRPPRPLPAPRTAGARLEPTLGCTAHNLTRLARLP